MTLKAFVILATIIAGLVGAMCYLHSPAGYHTMRSIRHAIHGG